MEPITSLLDAFIKLADRIVNLEKTRLQDKKDLFNEIVKPTFEELEPVVSNYMDFFRKAKKSIIESPQEDLQKVAQYIDEERRAMLVSRIKVREMTNQIREQIKDKEIADFAFEVTNFFYRAGETNKFQSVGEELTVIIKWAAIRNQEKEMSIKFIDGALEILEKSWASIVKSYVKLKISLTSSPKFVNKVQKDK